MTPDSLYVLIVAGVLVLSVFLVVLGLLNVDRGISQVRESLRKEREEATKRWYEENSR